MDRSNGSCRYGLEYWCHGSYRLDRLHWCYRSCRNGDQYGRDG